MSVKLEDIEVSDPTHEYREYRQKVKKYISLFKFHIFDLDHPVNIINRYFVKVFCSYLKNKIHWLISQNFEESELMKQAGEFECEITHSLQKYIVKLQSCIRLMYAKCMNYQCFLEERDDFINLVTSLVFNEETLYKTIFQLYELTLISQKKILEGKLKDFCNVQPEDLGIKDNFCLNEKTFDLQQKLFMDKQKKEIKNKETINKDNSTNSNSNRDSNINNNINVSALNNESDDIIIK